MYEPFETPVETDDLEDDYLAYVIHTVHPVQGDQMKILTNMNEGIYITKEQVMKFFGLVEDNSLPPIPFI